MAKHIAVFGSPGSGKSIFCAALAKSMSKSGKVILISYDDVVPMQPFYCGNTDTKGLGELLSNELNIENTATAVKILPKHQQIGVIGFKLGEKSSIYNIDLLWKNTDKLVDVVLWDCTSDLENPITSFALSMAHIHICVLTVDTKGILYYENNKAQIKSIDNLIMIAGLAKPYSPIEEMSLRVNGFDGILPYSREIERVYLEGNVFSVDEVCSDRYKEVVNMAAECLLRINNEEVF